MLIKLNLYINIDKNLHFKFQFYLVDRNLD